MSAAAADCTELADETCALLQTGGCVRDPGAADSGAAAWQRKIRLPSGKAICYIAGVKVSACFAMMRARPDRAPIRDEWIDRAIRFPIREQVRADGRIRRWTQVPEMGDRFLRVVLLPDGETMHNAFFDRRFVP